MRKIDIIINSAFREITEKGVFDIAKGNEPIPKIANKEMSLVPSELTNYVNDCGYGCCFVFSSYMLNILNRYNINAYLIATVEYYGDKKGTRASVLYEDNGKWYVANPVEDIEYFTNNNVPFEERKKYYLDDTATMIVDGITHNDSRYTLEEFQEKYGTIWLVGSMNDNPKTLNEEMSNIKDKCIAPPEQANYDLKRLIKK